MCIGERIHTVRFGGKVFGQVQGDAAAVQDLSLTLLFSLLLTLLSVLSITFFFSLIAASSRFLGLSFPLISQSLLRKEKPSFLSLSFSFCPFSPPLLPSGLLVSFRFSSLGISLRCARGDLGARPPTRELVNYFAQRDTSFLLSSVPYCHHLILSCSLSLSLSLLLSFEIFRSPKCTTRCALYIRAEVRFGRARRRFLNSDKVYAYRKARFRESAHVQEPAEIARA